MDIHEKLLLPRTSGRFLITAMNCPPQTGHDDLEHRERKNNGYFVTINGCEQCTLWVSRGSYSYVFYSDKEKEILRDVFRMEEVVLPAECVFFGHGSLNHAGGGWKRNHPLRYHTYVIPEDVEIKDAVAFAYGGQ